MKSLLTPLASLLFACASLANLPEPVLAWDFSRARVLSESAEIASTIGDNAVLFIGSGPGIVAENATPSGRRFSLDGTQKEAGKTQRIVEPMDGLVVRARFKPSGQGERLQTIVSLFGTYELRYDNEKETVEFIVSYPEKKYSNAKVPAGWGAWAEVVATYKGGRITISNRGRESEAVLPPEARPAPSRTYLRFGRSVERPFSGLIGEISLAPY